MLHSSWLHCSRRNVHLFGCVTHLSILAHLLDHKTVRRSSDTPITCPSSFPSCAVVILQWKSAHESGIWKKNENKNTLLVWYSHGVCLPSITLITFSKTRFILIVRLIFIHYSPLFCPAAARNTCKHNTVCKVTAIDHTDQFSCHEWIIKVSLSIRDSPLCEKNGNPIL